MEDHAQSATPFTAKECIDRRRACDILGVGMRTLERMAASGRIGYIDPSKKSHKRLYQSLVDFCDRLRQEHADCRSAAGAGRTLPAPSR